MTVLGSELASPNQPLPLGLHRVLQLSSHLFVLSILVFYLASYYASVKKLERLIYFLYEVATSSTNGVAVRLVVVRGKKTGALEVSGMHFRPKGCVI